MLRGQVPLALAAVAMAAGTAAAVHYARADLTLSHYDARAHLVVARRVLDSITPGWQQIGAVWLPLPHVLNMVPVQVDAWYRTGASAVALSVLSIGVAAWAMGSFILRATGSASGAVAAVALLVANPNVLYLQSTPMTEPLLFGLTALAVAWTAAWLDGAGAGNAVRPGLALAAACLTRYEAWPIAAATVALAFAVMLRRNVAPRTALRNVIRLAAYPLVAIVVFVLNSRWTVGEWFVTGGFFVPENVEALGHPLAAWRQVREGLYKVSGTALVWSAYAGAALALVAWVASRRRATIVLAFALAAAAALPLYAYVNGHPFRIRYDVPLVAAAAMLSGSGIGLVWRRVRPLVAVLIVAVALAQAPPLDRTAPMVVEAQRDARNMHERRAVTEYLRAHYDGGTIFVSMGSLGHYMQELSRAGLDVKDFMHEGNDRAWPHGLLRARSVATWVMIEERAEGGDALAIVARRNPRFLEGFDRVSEGGGVALYRARSVLR